jgi:hypothetical protein
MNKLFILIAYLACALFSAATPDTAIGTPAQRTVVVSIRNTAEEFARFVERAQQSPFSSKVGSKIAEQIIRFCKFEGHYVETNPDLVNQNAYFGVLLDDYSPLFAALQTFDRDPSSTNANALFDCMLDIYTRNLRDQTALARKSLADDVKFGTPQASGWFYEANGLDFFRSPNLLPNYERFVGNSQIKGLARNHTSFLREKRTELLRTKETQIEYRQHVENHLNQLFYMAWRIVLDRNSLSSRTRAILVSLPYVHKILKQGQCINCNYDLLIADSIKNPDNQLHGLFAIMQSPHVTDASLPKTLLPNKKKARKKKAVIPAPPSQGNIPSDLPPAGSDDDTEEGDVTADAHKATSSAPASAPAHDGAGEKDEVADLTLATSSAPTSPPALVHTNSVEEQGNIPSDLPPAGSDDDAEEGDVTADAHKGTSSAPVPLHANASRVQPALYQAKDWQNGRLVALVYDLYQLTKDSKRASYILEKLGSFHESKFVSYKMVQSLYRELGGVIVNTKGSHETWEFNSGANKVKTTFFKLHDKDQYGPWTKLDVEQVILDVLEPYLVQAQ